MLNTLKKYVMVIFMLIVTLSITVYAQEPVIDLSKITEIPEAIYSEEKVSNIEVMKTEDGIVIQTIYDVKKDITSTKEVPSAMQLIEEEQAVFEKSLNYEKTQSVEKLTPINYLEYGYKTEEEMINDLSDGLLLKDNAKIEGVYHENIDGEEGIRITIGIGVQDFF